MPSILIVETGTGVANANTYIDATYANTYFTLYGNSDWSGDDTAKETALVQAAQSLDLLYGPRYASATSSSTQTLLWPRAAFYDRNGNLRSSTSIPEELKKAQAELALGILTGAVSATPEPKATNNIKESSEKVGELQVSYKYTGPIQGESYEGYRKIDLLLWSIVKSDSGTLTLHR